VAHDGWHAATLTAAVAVAAAVISACGGERVGTIAVPDSAGNVGQYASLELDAVGNPVITYRAVSGLDLKVVHCNDRACAGDGEVFAQPDATERDIARRTSLELDARGNPVVAYEDFTELDLKVLHCGNPDCTAGNSITTPDAEGTVGRWNALALDAAGNPVVSYHDGTHGDLKVLHCNDPDCRGGDESIARPDMEGDTGWWSALAVDALGNPVVAYHNASNRDLHILHCNDPDCGGGDDSVVALETPGAVDGLWPSLALDGAGNPVIAHYDRTHGDLLLVHCDDPLCDGDESRAVDGEGDVGRRPSLQLDAAGHPVIAYEDFGNEDLKILRCNDPACTGGDEHIAAIDKEVEVGRWASLVLDSDDVPVVAYYDLTNGDLKLLRCADASCRRVRQAREAGYCFDIDADTRCNEADPDDDGDGCADERERQTAPGSEASGGRRDPTNTWDYFNPTRDRYNRIDDVLAVVRQYGQGEYLPDLAPNPRYQARTDRTFRGPEPWDLGPPDNLQTEDDVLLVIAQYFHDCG
jgi:hypothetical protein